MKVFSIKHKENLDALSNIINASMQTEADYETLKYKTEDIDLQQWIENKQESTTDFILAGLRLFDELSNNVQSSIGLKNDFDLDTLNTRSLIVNLEPEILKRECKKIDESHWYLIIQEMSKHEVDSKIYKFLNKRLEKLNYGLILEENPTLLVG